MKRNILIQNLFFLLVLPATATAGSLFPEITGWKLREEQRIYTGNDLWELIDGAADIFLSYDFEDLHIAEYMKNDQVIRVELYKHATLENAYGIYTAERMPDYPQVNIGSQGYKSQGILNFLSGLYYVKIMSAGPEEAEESQIALAAHAVNDKLDQPAGLPNVLQLFPKEGMESLSDSYIAKNFLGYGFLHSAFTCRYNTGTEFQLFIIRAAPEEIQRMLDEYLRLAKDSPGMKGSLHIVSDPYNSTVFLEQKGTYLVGILNATDEALASRYIDLVTQKIP